MMLQIPQKFVYLPKLYIDLDLRHSGIAQKFGLVPVYKSFVKHKTNT